MASTRNLLLLTAMTLCLASCGDRGAPSPGEGGLCSLPSADTKLLFPQSIERAFDVLLVIDSSPAMQAKADQLARSLPGMIEAMRLLKLGNDLPDLHLGVISADLGAGPFAVPGCNPGGDGAKLLRAPRRVGCAPPADPWINYVAGLKGETNVSGSGDPVERVKKALSCIGELGSSGCRFAQPLEAARRALDPKLNINPGFLRKDAYLMVVFFTSGDDCSAKKLQLFDPQTGPLGPLSPFRCFEFGVACTCPGGGACSPTAVGPRIGCKPAHDWLHRVEDYADFFGKLKSPGRVMVSVVSGPTGEVAVGTKGGAPTLRPSCDTAHGQGTPAIRLEALAKTFDGGINRGYFNQGIVHPHQEVPVTICDSDHSPALGWLGQQIVCSLGSSCVQGPLLTSECGLACAPGVTLGPGARTCQRSCLRRADCAVELILADPSAPHVAVSPCPAPLFDDSSRKDCGGSCPCWRIMPHKACTPQLDGSPFKFELLHANGRAPRGSVARLSCATAPHDWGSEGMLALPQCSAEVADAR